MDSLIVFEYIHKRDTVNTALALSGKGVLPLTSIGGDGQAKIQIDGTLSTSGDLTIGSLELNACGLSGVYKPDTDIYETTSFKAGDINTNLDPKIAAVNGETKKEATGQDTQVNPEGTGEQKENAGAETQDQV